MGGPLESATESDSSVHTTWPRVRVGGLVLAVAVFILLQLMPPRRAAAANPSIGGDYDLDSLVYLSSGIVEGRLVGPSELRITAVHAGNLQVGEMVRTDWGGPSGI